MRAILSLRELIGSYSMLQAHTSYYCTVLYSLYQRFACGADLLNHVILLSAYQFSPALELLELLPCTLSSLKHPTDHTRQRETPKQVEPGQASRFRQDRAVPPPLPSKHRIGRADVGGCFPTPHSSSLARRASPIGSLCIGFQTYKQTLEQLWEPPLTM